MISKSLESALSAMSHLAEVYAEGRALTAEQIASGRRLNRPFVAKLLTALRQAGLVTSKPGRNGGFSLARPPGEIHLLDIAIAIGYRARVQCCPFGPQYGDFNDGVPHKPCPLHQEVGSLKDHIASFLENNTLAGFAHQDDE